MQKIPVLLLFYSASSKRPSWAAGPSIALLAIALTLPVYAKPAPPIGLLVNGVRNPTAIERSGVRFTWMSSDATRGASQTAFQVLVASSPELLTRGEPDYWDSGKLNSDKSAAVEYQGKELPSAVRLWWKVRIWDQNGKPGFYSAPAFFDTGLAQDDWQADYIWDGTTNQNNFAYFRKAFAVPRTPCLAKVYVTAHNDYILFFNGHLLGRGPARCDPYHYGQYNAYDISKWVNIGTNVFAAIGHWHGLFNDSAINAKPAFLLETRFDYADGSSSTIGTDVSWKTLAHTAFVETNAAFFSVAEPNPQPPQKNRSNPPHMWTTPDETTGLPPEFVECDWLNGGSSNRAAIQFDSRREPAGWQTINFDDSSWAHATVVNRSLYRLFAQMAPRQREQAEMKPVNVTSTNGAWLVDFGRCLNGWPKLTMRKNRPGDKVRIEYFQMTGQQYPAGWDQYTCRGGAETWHADFGRHTSFQQIKITGYAGKLKPSDVRAMWAYCDADVAGHFRCSSDLLNAIYALCERSARQNVQQAIISVDANREQSSWTADSWHIGNVLLYNHRDTMMIDKVIRDYAGEQLPHGDFPGCSPAQRASFLPEWSMYWPMLLWEQYLFSGDQALLREMAPRLTRFLNWIGTFQNPTNKLINPPGWRISDWAGVTKMPSFGYNVATACQYYENLRIASRVYSLLGQENRSRDYLQQAEAVSAGINANLFNGEYYLVRPEQNEMWALASAWPLRFGIEAAADRPKIIAAIERAGQPQIGGYGGDAFYSGLFNAGAGALAVRDLNRYRSMLEGNKANWESFGLNPSRGYEVNHAWTAYPGYLFQKYILGIQPTSGGFATFDVRPETGGLTFAEGQVPTVKGDIITRWRKRSDRQFTLSVRVPPNTRATIYLPKLQGPDVRLTESGKSLWPAKPGVQVPGVLAVEEESSRFKCLVSAGTYRFRETQ